MTKDIRLQAKRWTFDESRPLGLPGGFGEVFRGSGDEGDVAVKRLNLSADAAAHRELRLGSALAERDLKHVVPILDYGQDADSDRYFLVMPICDFSLQDQIGSRRDFSWLEVCQLMLSVIDGLVEVENIVHRDLKPANILFHEGVWKVADFGIAKFVEESTSLQTLRSALTPQYAAPEQWRIESPSHATDVYALGCIFYALMNGDPPFGGDVDQLRDAHLSATPPRLSGVGPRIAGLVQNMLRKPPASRPSLNRCRSVIETSQEVEVKGRSGALAQAGMHVAGQEALIEAKQTSEEAEKQKRMSQVSDANSHLIKIFANLKSEAVASAESVRASNDSITLGPVQLSWDVPHGLSSGVQGQNFTVLSHSKIEIACDIEQRAYADRPCYRISASLLFSDFGEVGCFRWFEVSFRHSMNAEFWQEPLALPPERELLVALSPTMGNYVEAFGPVAIDAEDEQSFLDRWLGLFARGAVGNTNGI